MRFLTLAVLSLTLVAPSLVHAETNHSFGSAVCRQTFPCPDGSNVTPQELAASGDYCIRNDLALGASSTYFDDQAGLDSSNCLTEKSGASKAGGNALHPKCCVVTIKENVCAFSCEIMTVQQK